MLTVKTVYLMTVGYNSVVYTKMTEKRPAVKKRPVIARAVDTSSSLTPLPVVKNNFIYKSVVQ